MLRAIIGPNAPMTTDEIGPRTGAPGPARPAGTASALPTATSGRENNSFHKRNYTKIVKPNLTARIFPIFETNGPRDRYGRCFYVAQTNTSRPTYYSRRREPVCRGFISRRRGASGWRAAGRRAVRRTSRGVREGGGGTTRRNISPGGFAFVCSVVWMICDAGRNFERCFHVRASASGHLSSDDGFPCDVFLRRQRVALSEKMMLGKMTSA
ncbi:hypothetical protein EVAR_41029_1 [Eumeta japonica]|uniref:Uncharacterized protein n=1 Tax=Eumeta variegata TaxID=151549 RepID=A0A4C1Z1I1_EUMVA|nr:hypothetical protein EVAR_41029_1 [Eumeta japonica]